MTGDVKLPPGQRERAVFPRFGLTPYATRFPAEVGRVQLQIIGDLSQSVALADELKQLARIEQISDFHCVTTWTCRAVRWSGVRFCDFYHQLVMPRIPSGVEISFVVLRGQDGYRANLSLQDLLATDVMLADHLNGEPLSIAHGAPLRLVAPAHYGYKSVKHLNRIEFWQQQGNYRPAGFRFMAHPRARVAHEERGQWAPGWLLRYLYRPLIKPTVVMFERELQKHLKQSNTNDR